MIMTCITAPTRTEVLEQSERTATALQAAGFTAVPGWVERDPDSCGWRVQVKYLDGVEGGAA